MMRTLLGRLFVIMFVVSPGLGISVANSAEDKVSILFGGDTSFGESYQEEYAAKGGENILVERGYDHSIRGLAAFLNDADYTILNLETPLTAVKVSPHQDKDYIHWSDPDKSTAGLREYGVDAISLANNHTLDVGPTGLVHTLEAARKYGIDTFGAGLDESAAKRPLLKTFDVAGKPLNVAVVGVFEYRKSYEKYDFYATAEKPGTYGLDVEKLQQQIADLRASDPAMLIVVYPHWGDNYVWRSDEQQQIGRQLIDAGADLVIGHGSHRLQEIESYGRGWIFYSIGNFMFNSGGRFKKLNSPPYSLVLFLDVTRDQGKLSKSVRLYPINGDNRETNYQPRPVSNSEFAEVRRLLVDHSTGSNLDASLKSENDRIGPYFHLSINNQ